MRRLQDALVPDRLVYGPGGCWAASEREAGVGRAILAPSESGAGPATVTGYCSSCWRVECRALRSGSSTTLRWRDLCRGH